MDKDAIKKLRETEKKLTEAYSDEKISKEKIKSLLHELQVHQIELEMQNEELRRTYLSIEEAKDRYMDLYNFAPSGYVTLDKTGCILEANHTFAKFLKIERGGLIKKFFSSFMIKEDTDKFYIYLRDIFKYAAGKTCEVRLISSDKKVYYVRVQSEFAADPQNPLCRSIITDITDLKKAEEQLILAKEKAEKDSEDHNRYLSLVAHDLNGPISSISRMLEYLYENLPFKLEEKQNRSFTMVISAAKKMQRLVSDIFSTWNYKGNLINVKFRYTRVDRLITGILNNLKIDAGKKNIYFINEVTGQDEIFTNETHLRHVLENLIINAVKFSKEGDAITVSIKETEPYTIVISDTGTGIPPHMMNQIFTFNRNLSLLGTAGEVGSGLGLPLSQEIMKTLGGRLEVESSLGGGTRCFVKLDLIIPRILIVDNDKVFRTEQIENIQKLKLRCIEADNTIDAMAKIEKDPPHMIITDVNAAMDGIELLRQVKSNMKTEEIPVIVISDDLKMREEALRYGANHFLVKPVVPEELILIIKRFLW